MTVASEENIIVYTRSGSLTEYTYPFRADSDDDIHVFINNILQVSGYTIARALDNVGGLITMDSVGVGGDLISITRIIDIDQGIDYTPYDAFPAETHERGLDKLTMIAQQLAADRERNVRIPESEDPNVVGTVLPPVAERAEKYMFFDEDGSVTAVEADLAAPSVFRVDIQDGTGGEDSRDMLLSETISGGANYPKIGVRNVNQANGLVQLTDQGNLPPGLINIIGIQIRGPFRGDDLCDKLGDDPGQCTAPDTRNPSERSPGLVDSFSIGDTFIITMGESETSGTMNLFLYVGETAPAIRNVNARDGIIYAEEVRHPDTDEVLTYEGWYLYPKLVETGDASFISYNPTGNQYVTGNNVQVAVDQVDDHFVNMDNWFTTQRVTTREAILHNDADAILAGGHYRLPPGSAGLPNLTSEFYISQMQGSGANLTQVAVDRNNGAVWGRGMVDGAWRPWRQAGGDIPTGTVMLFYQANAPEGWTKIGDLDDVMVRVVSGVGGGSGGSDSPILNDKVPSHNHPASSTNAGEHQHSFTVWRDSTGGNNQARAGQTTNSIQQNTTLNGIHNHPISVFNNAGANNWTPKYINCILCEKL